MKQYQTKPSSINAVQWDESKRTLKESGAKMMACEGHVDRLDLCYNLRIETYEGTKLVKLGDWIIEVDGIYRVVSDMVFSVNYTSTDEN